MRLPSDSPGLNEDSHGSDLGNLDFDIEELRRAAEAGPDLSNLVIPNLGKTATGVVEDLKRKTPPPAAKPAAHRTTKSRDSEPFWKKG